MTVLVLAYIFLIKRMKCHKKQSQTLTKYIKHFYTEIVP